MNLSSNQPYRVPKLVPTPVSSHQYTGVTLDLKKHGSLTSHGAFLPPSAPTRDSGNRGDIQAAESFTTLRNAPGTSTVGHHQKDRMFNQMGPNVSTHAGTNDSPFSSEAEIHPSSGVPLNQTDSTMPTTTLPQHANFSQLAEHQGIHDWNNSVFDDRWLLQPEEIWNLKARRESALSVSPERLALNHSTFRTGDHTGLHTEGSQHPSTQDTHMQHAVREAAEKNKEYCGRLMSTAPTETRGDHSGTFAASPKLAAGQSRNHTNQ